jgi:hypothetical protein
LFTLAITGCKQSSGGQDSTGSMKMDGSPTSTMPATMSSAMIYTCTMHPEVTSDKPGKCPKCGMDLVAKK